MPPFRTTLGQLLINSVLPDDLQDHNRVLDKKGVAELMQKVAVQYPDRYREIAKQLSDVGRDAAYTTGGHSFGLKAIRPSLAGRRVQLEARRGLRKILSNSSLSPEEQQDQIILQTGAHQKKLVDDVLQESRDEDNPLAHQLMGAGRGNPYSLNSLRGADLLYSDHRGDPIPIPVLHSYSQGLTPAEYFAGAFGARKGIMDLKSATQDAGFFSKQLVQANHRLLVSDLDDDQPYNEHSPRGLPVAVDDPDNEGALLAHPVAGYPRNTKITPKLMSELKSHGIAQILVRSPTVGGPSDGGVYARDVGHRERGDLAPRGDYVGIAAAQALAEPITQAQISSKHTGGIAGAAGAGAISGFKYINSLVQVPKTFPGGATHAQRDGRVQSVHAAPQGGTYVVVDGEQHYAPAGTEIHVKPGDTVEAGDTLSAGTPNPAEVVKHKGIGEGRRYFTQAFKQALTNSGTYGNRRNIELLARGLINHVRLTDEVGDWVPGDVVPYAAVERHWEPRLGSIMVPPQQAVGHYLERPVLHYSVGTKIGKGVLSTLKQHGVTQIEAHKEPPPFQPEMIRGMANVAQDDDWMTKMLGSYQQKSLLTSVHRGGVSDTHGTSFVPALAEGKDFGLSGPTQGWKVGA